MREIETFDSTVQKTNIWLKEIMEEEGWEDRHKAYLALRAALHALRDRLTPEEAVQLAAQFPMLVRGFYFDGWKIAGKPEKVKTKEEFLQHVSRELPPADPELDPERVARAAFSLLARHVSKGQIQEVLSTLPGEIRDLWPHHLQA